MKVLLVVTSFAIALTNADEWINEKPIESLDDVLVHPVIPATKIRKREAASKKDKKDDFNEFVQEKLVQHTRVLEHLLKMAQKGEELTTKLIENLSSQISPPSLPEKIEVHRTSMPNDNESSVADTFVKLGKNITKISNLAKDVVINEVRDEPDPLPVIEQGPELNSRRSMNGRPAAPASFAPPPPGKGLSPWCPIAVLCRRTKNPACGFDDNFGYGKFEDVCHMLQVNCYWNYNFAVIADCHPVYVQ